MSRDEVPAYDRIRDVDQSRVDTIRVCGHFGQGCVQGAVQTLPTAGQFDRPVGGTQRVGTGQQHLSLDRMMAAPLHGEPGGGNTTFLEVCRRRQHCGESGVEPLLGADPQLATQRGARREAVIQRTARRAGSPGHCRHGHRGGPVGGQ